MVQVSAKHELLMPRRVAHHKRCQFRRRHVVAAREAKGKDIATAIFKRVSLLAQ